MNKDYRDVLREIEETKNHSWAKELEIISANKRDKVALKYRDQKITYGEYINTYKYEWAKAIKANGGKKGDRYFISVSTCPEYAYLFGAVSTVAGVFNSVSEEFDNDYIFELMKKSTFDYIFVSEDRVNEIYDSLLRLNNETNKKVVIIPLERSLPNGNPYKSITDQFDNTDYELLERNLNSLTNIVDIEDFLDKGKEYDGVIEENSSLDDLFTITYSSGTTDGNKPKGIMHRVRHYSVMGRYHEKDVSGLPSLNNSVTYSTIPNHSNSFLASILSDTLHEGATVALDPITAYDYLLYGLLINQPTMAIATPSSWEKAAKIYYSMDLKSKLMFKFLSLIFLVAVGEELSMGQEKFLNKFIVDTKCGINFTKFPIPVTKFSTCGGCCELGSLLTRGFRAYASLKKDKYRKEPIGFNTYDFVDIQVLRDDGTHCEPYECGRLVADSVCTMIGYDDAPEKTSKFFITDAYGKTYGDMGSYGYKDKNGYIYMKGRPLEDQSLIPEYVISDVVSLDTKNVLSNSVVYLEDEKQYVIYVEKQPFSKMTNSKLYRTVAERCKSKFGDDIIDKLNIYVLDKTEEFPVTACRKRDIKKLRNADILLLTKNASNLVQLVDKVKTKIRVKK